MKSFEILLGYADPEMLEGLGWALEHNGDLSIEEKTPDWKEDVINPLLGNFPH